MVSIEHDALKRFIKATEEFEGRFAVALAGKSGPKAETGETYVEYINGKSRLNGHVFLDEAFPSTDRAFQVTFERLNEAFPDVAGCALYWRIKPEIDYSERRKGYVTYCRFLVSDKKSEGMHPHG